MRKHFRTRFFALLVVVSLILGMMPITTIADSPGLWTTPGSPGTTATEETNETTATNETTETTATTGTTATSGTTGTDIFSLLESFGLSIGRLVNPFGLRLGSDALEIEQVENQEARIINADPGKYPGGVDWGAEPVVLTVRLMSNGRYISDYTGIEIKAHIDDEDLLAYSLGGANGNILTLVPYDETGIATVTVTADDGDNYAEMTFRVDINRYVDTGKYDWGELAIHGAGAVSGYIFHPYVEGILYAHTDVGGLWRFEFEYDSSGKATGGRWEDITIWISAGGPGQSRMFGLDPTPGREGWIYAAYGGTGTLIRSYDQGDTWHHVRNVAGDANVTIGLAAGGNSGNTRSAGGDFLTIVPNRISGPAGSRNPADYGNPTMYATSTNGIRVSTDNGASWTAPAGTGQPTTTGLYMGVYYDKNNPNFLIQTRHVSAADANGGAFYSSDGGANWTKLPGHPDPRGVGVNLQYYAGKAAFSEPLEVDVPNGVAAGDRYIYVTFTNKAEYNDGQRGDGAVFRWQIDSAGALKNNRHNGTTEGVNITPQMYYTTPVMTDNSTAGPENRQAGVGISALDVSRADNALLIGTHNTDPYDADTRLTNRGEETVYRSLDYGETWFPVLGGFEMFGDLAFGEKSGLASPAVNGELQTNKWTQAVQEADPGTQVATESWWEPWTFLHWNFAHKVNPHNPDNMFINSGLGTYVAYNLTALDQYAGQAKPNAMNEKGLTVEQARTGLFTTTGAGKLDMRIATPGNTNSRVTDDYNEFRMHHVVNSPNGNLTRADMVRWETAPGLYMTVQKSTLFSPATGDNIVYANTADYPGFMFSSLDDNPWSGYSWGQWIPPVWNYLYDGTGDRGDGDLPFSGQGFDWQRYTDTVDEKFLPPKPAGLEDATIYAATNRGIFGNTTAYSDMNPDVVVSTNRLDWHFMSRGGAIISFDGGKIWHTLPAGWEHADPNKWTNHPSTHLLGIGDEIAPNITDTLTVWGQSAATAGRDMGTVALGADGATVLWAPPGRAAGDAWAGNGGLNHLEDWRYARVDDILNPSVTMPWNTLKVFQADDSTPMADNTRIRIEPDPVDGDYFYAFSAVAPNFWVSSDGGANFYHPATVTLNEFNYGGPAWNQGSTIEANQQDYDGPARVIRKEVGEFGSFLIDGDGSLFRLKYDADSNTAEYTRISGQGAPNASDDGFNITSGRGRAGYGLGPNTDSEFKETGFLQSINGAIYAHGRKTEVQGDAGTGIGVFRSLDGGANWTKISPSALNSLGHINPNGILTEQGEYVNANRPFTDVRGLTGDPRVFGRVYLSQGNVAGGIAYGDIIVELVESGEAASKSELEKLVLAAESLVEADYDPASWAIFARELENARAVLADPDASVTQIHNQTQALFHAILQLAADKSVLETIIRMVSAVSLSDYTEASANVLRSELAKAKGIFDDPEATPVAVKEAVASLLKAFNSLVLREKDEETQRPGYSTSTSRRRGGGGGGGGGGAPAAPAPLFRPADRASAISSITSGIARLRNTGLTTLDIIKAIAAAGGVRVRADSIPPMSNIVEVRVSFNPLNATKDISLYGRTTSDTARARKALFERWFSTPIVAAVVMEQQDSFGMMVDIAAKVDLTGMDTSDLHFYSYNAATNNYTRIVNPNYRIDANGYIHFTTSHAGVFIISDGPLVKRS